MSEASEVERSIEGLWHFDGSKAVKTFPAALVEPLGLVLKEGDERHGPFLWDDLILLDTPPGSYALGHRTISGWRLGGEGDLPAALRTRIVPAGVYGSLVDRFGLGRATVVSMGVAACVIVVALKMPTWLLPLVPANWENRLGDVMAHDIGGRQCRSSGGDAALTRLVTLLDQERRVRSIMVVDAPMVNAVTLPGGRIVIFRGLVAQLHSPDALAGIIGHEIGHIQHRDGVAALIRHFGLKSALGGLNGEGSSYAQAMIGLSYSRDAERAADDQSIEILRRAQINPLITARFFDDALKEPTMLGETWLSTHPLSKERSQFYAGSLNRSTFYRAALSEEDWSALQSICASARR